MIASFVLLVAICPSRAQVSQDMISEGFEPGFEARWMERKLNGGRNQHVIEEDDGDRVLRIDSNNGASALWRSLMFRPVEGSRIRWRWKIEEAFDGRKAETERSGDDYAARVFVIFDPVLFDLEMRAVCYVWAAREAVGSAYSNPYSGNVATVVLRSGDRDAGEWVFEERDFAKDFEQFFGEAPEMVTALAVMVDTDNTGARGRAWFDDLELKRPAGESPVSQSPAGTLQAQMAQAALSTLP